jgi:hypothetical protein
VATSFNKRDKEKRRQEWHREKEARRQQRKDERAQRPQTEDGVDPDIAGIVPGPQPLPEEFRDPDEGGESEQ